MSERHFALDYDLTLTQSRVIIVLFHAIGDKTLAELNDILGRENRSGAITLKSLVHKGLVESARKIKTKGRPANAYCLTQKGYVAGRHLTDLLKFLVR